MGVLKIHHNRSVLGAPVSRPATAYYDLFLEALWFSVQVLQLHFTDVLFAVFTVRFPRLLIMHGGRA